MKYCSLYYRKEGTYIFSLAKTVTGLHIKIEPVLTLSPESPPAEIGETILKALQAYRKEVHLEESDELKKPRAKNPILKSIGFRSWHAFYQEAAGFNITDNGAEIEIIPYRTSEKGDLFPISEDMLKCLPEPEAIGKLLSYFLRMKRIFVFIREDAIYIFWRKDDVCIRQLDSTTTQNNLGDNIIQAINESNSGILDKEDFQNLSRDLLRTEGYKTWKSFTSGTRSYEIDFFDSTLKIIPLHTKQKGKDMIIKPVQDQAMTSAFDPVAIGTLLMPPAPETPIIEEPAIPKEVPPKLEKQKPIKTESLIEKTKRCLVFFRDEAITIICYYKGPVSWILSEPLVNLPREIPAIPLGDEILKIIEASTTGISQLDSSFVILPGVAKTNPELVISLPDERFSKIDTFIKSAGYKSWDNFTKKAIAFEIRCERNKTTVIPLRSFHKGAFLYMEEQSITCAENASALGETLFRLQKIKYVDVYLGNKLLKTYAQFEGAEPFIAISSSSTAEMAGNAILQTFTATVPADPSFWMKLRQKFIENHSLAKQEEEFKKESQFFRIINDGNTLKILPFFSINPGEFKPYSEGAVMCNATSQEIGNALLKLSRMKRISLYVKENAFYILYRSSETQLFKLDTNISSQLLGETILQAFKLTRQTGVMDRTVFWKLNNPGLSFANFKNWKTFLAETMIYDLEYFDPEIKIIPKNIDPEGTFHLLIEESITCPHDPAQLGTALRKLF